ncbi:glycosyltransferase family 1 protein [Paenibacillus antri]|uniref:Glycosyltransferase family 1 protein n=1 Tax=Paenibacillus antri TaxID=2582848 RepID=A0A5R9G2K1_9BACL|nr:glycosyltransferase [Paenibacillus antri]TLS50582.1 glycosyltransferase family 1 protein [Paenibacillus antri]
MIPRNVRKQETIVLFNGQSQYDVLRYFIADMAVGFRTLGYHVTIIDLLKENWLKELQKTINEMDILFFFSMNGMAIDLKIGDKSLYDQLNIPFFAFFVDHPMYQLPRLNAGVKNLIVSCVDQKHIEFLNKYMQGDYSKVFIPHGSSNGDFPSQEQVPLVPIIDREIDILFTGTYANPESYRNEWRSLNKHVAELFDDIAEVALSQNEKTMVEIAEETLSSRGIDSIYMHHGNFWSTLVQVDLYNRTVKRREVVTKLAQLPVRFEIYGNGWDELQITNNTTTFHPFVSFEMAQEKMRNSKLVLTILPSFTSGGHERVFSSMLHGAVSMVNRNIYFEKHFKDRDSILLYDFGTDIQGTAASMLDDLPLMQQVADGGRESALERHTWKQRAEEIIKHVQYHKFFTS